MTRVRRNAIIATLLLGNLILVGVAAYEVTNNVQLSAANTNSQQEVLSLRQEIAQLRSNISTVTAQNGDEIATIQALNLTANSLGQQIGRVNAYLNMQNVTTLGSNKSITIMPVIPGIPYSGPNMTFVLNFTAKYAGYLIIRSNVTTDAFVKVVTYFAGCDLFLGICQTVFSPTISGSRPPLIPVLPGVVIVEVGSNAPISPQHAWIDVQYTT